MKKLALKILSQEDEEIIAKTLYDILIDYNPYKRSDHNYIKISICLDIAIIIKMLNPFCNGKSCILMAYVTNGSDESDKCIYGQAMQYNVPKETIEELLKVGVHAISKSLISLITALEVTDSLIIYHNFDEELPKRSFHEVMRIKWSQNEEKRENDICETFAYIMSNLNSVNNCMMFRLYFDINIGDPEHISAEYTFRIQYSYIFNESIYSFSLTYPDGTTSTDYGHSKEEAEELILHYLSSFMRVAGYVVKDEVGVIVLYEQKKESNYV